MGKQEYLSAGRFAALVGTTKETLFHYDEIGLFVPKRRGIMRWIRWKRLM